MLDETERARYDRLLVWRRETSRRDGVPPYVLLNNRQTLELARRAPRSLEGLGQVKGVGKKRVARHGVAILETLHGRCPVSPSRPAGPNDLIVTVAAYRPPKARETPLRKADERLNRLRVLLRLAHELRVMPHAHQVQRPTSSAPFGRRCIPPGGVALPRKIPDIPAETRLARRAPRRPRWSPTCGAPYQEEAARRLAEVGRLLGGWRKQSALPRSGPAQE